VIKKSMLWWAICILLGGLLSGPALAKDEQVTSTWTASAPKVDGQAEDWAGLSRSLDKSSQVEYAVCNDGENLYVLLIFKNPRSLSTIGLTGITLFFSPEGKRDKDRGVRFIRRDVDANQLIAALEKQGQTLTEERKQELRARNQYRLYDSHIIDGDGKTIAQAVGSGRSLPPVFRVGSEGSAVVYEFRLPLSGREDHPAAIGTAPGRALKVGFEWGGMTPEIRARLASQVGSQSTQAVDSPNSFDQNSISEGNDDTRGNNASLASLMRGPKKHAFWIDLALSAPALQ
jgi:hypothetical protein